jgi:shikimate dehydrogenase
MLIALIGEGVAPSLTPAMHELEGARHGMHYVYRTVELSPGEGTPERMREILDAARDMGFNGLNITHPVKQTVVPLLDELAPSAQAVGAVNTVVFHDDRLVGHNTDVTGFGAAFDEALADLRRDRVVLLGSGGAGAAVATALVDRGVGDLVIVDADAARATDLAASVARLAPDRVRSAPLDELPALLMAADGAVNATPVGMAGHPGAPFDVALLANGAFVADIVYRPSETRLLRDARERGLRVMAGLGMAMHQAADAFEIFTGEPADRQAMLADLQNLVAAERPAPAPVASDLHSGT